MATPSFRPAVWALCGLLAGFVPAGAQEAVSNGKPGGPRLLGVPVDSARPPEADPAVGSRGFWTRLRDEARRFRELNGGPFAFSLRYRIPAELARDIHRVASEEGIDPELAFRLVRAESGFNPRARSHAGALGLMQLMPYTARWLDRRMTTAERIMEPEANLRAGCRYLRQLIAKYDGNLRLALLAYNRGDGAVDRDLRRGRDPENGYTRRVLGNGTARYRGSGLLSR
ncbi:MAG TPA: lytic transglycosylase domain-containing protein [Longimicrobium sp.]|nr:lytic transglycosylase domain-containing protein [Longimicrobium sp.]